MRTTAVCSYFILLLLVITVTIRRVLQLLQWAVVRVHIHSSGPIRFPYSEV